MAALRCLFSFQLALLVFLGGPGAAWAQAGNSYDPSWYDPEQPHLRIGVTEDGVYRVDAGALQQALPDGTSLSDIDPETIRLFENGEEIPLQVDTSGSTFDPSDSITFLGRRNRGTDELWAYNGDASAQSSTHRSLYTDTTYYWMTWGGNSGLRYDLQSNTASSSPTSSLRDTVRAERDHRYYFGRPQNSGHPLYTESEGYYWTRFSHNSISSSDFTHTLPVGRRTASTTELDLTVRLDGGTNSCHRVNVEGRLRQGDGTLAYETLQSVEWSGFERRTVHASVVQDRIPSEGLEVRVTSHNGGFSSTDCPDASSTPNHVWLDWIEAAYTRSLEAREDEQRFVVPTTDDYTFSLTGYTSDTIHVYNPADARRYAVPSPNGSATVSDAPSSAPTAYWAVGDDRFRSPASIRPDAPSSWSDPAAHGADYVILTTEALLPSARRLADYRRSHDGYDVEVVLVQDVYDEFDYGRPTPIAIRRFVHATQDWASPPRFLTIFGDAQYPIRDGSVTTLHPEWSVPSFGYAPSDGWFAMQEGGPNDWSETLAVGRIPVRSVEQGNLFLDKLESYEAAPLERWQKRMLLLAGGTSESEQESLKFYSERWGTLAADTATSLDGEDIRLSAGMDTLQYYKQTNDALDASFQDSLAVDIQRGAGWLNYFGHSAAQTWEIVTDPPSEFDNAGRLPVVISLGCRTGSFAGGRFEEKSAPSLGEQLVVGSVRSDGTPRDGTLNGGIAHFGESALGNRLPSARLNDALVQRVFVDTMRVLGEAIRTAKAEVAANRGSSSLYAKHLMQYSLLGDPATNMALPARPDLHVASRSISVEPATPTPSDELTVSVQVENRGLIPSDSTVVRLTWDSPDGTTTQRTRRLPRFQLDRTLRFTFSLDEQALGSNTFRVRLDPEDRHTEADETNNVAERSQVVFDSGVSLVSPVESGTVSSQRPTLKFAVSRQTQDPVPVVVQVDATPDFSSTRLQQTQQEVDGMLGRWRPSSLEQHDTYYWRARLADADESTWKTGHFTVEPNLPENSWLQQGGLFSENENNQLTRSSKAWAFEEYERTVFIQGARGSESRVHGFIIDGTDRYEYLQLGFGVLVMDGTTGRVRESETFPTYDLADQYEDEVGDQQEAIDSLATFLDEVAREGDYVFVRTRHLARQSSATIPDTVKSLFRRLGTSSIADDPHSQAIDTLTYRHVWTMKARKGNPGATVERVSPPSEAGDVNEVNLEVRPSFSHPSGTTTTPRIGPASAWTSLRWSGTTSDATDQVALQVLAADSTVLLDDLTAASGKQSLEQIDAQAHPYLHLRATLRDSTSRTSPQLDQWSVRYEGVPELAVDPSALQSTADTLEQGEEGSVSLPIVNLGPVASDSIQVHYDLTDVTNSITRLTTDTLQALPPEGRDTSSATFSTSNVPGANVLTLNAESDGPPERFTSNNTAVKNVFVRKDQRPPSIQVLANGRDLPPTSEQINDLQDPSLPFVSTQPEIEILLDDDNPHLSLDDTSSIAVYLKGGLPRRDPSLISDYQRIPFSGDDLTLTSQDTGDPSAQRVLYTPSLSAQDSTYTLKVEAEDAKGNESDPYQASFRIQEEQVIREAYPYPNPMNTHTTFAFRVEGGQTENLRGLTLRIYTLSGRLVRQLDETDLDTPLGVGWNSLPWNGRDADGDRVGTGVYLYQVSVETHDSTFHGEVEKVTVIR